MVKRFKSADCTPKKIIEKRLLGGTAGKAGSQLCSEMSLYLGNGALYSLGLLKWETVLDILAHFKESLVPF